MGLFQRATNQQAYFKGGAFGFEGTGKTFTLALLAIGIHAYIKSKKPVAFFDTETGSDYVLPLFQRAGIELIVVKSRALKTLGDAMKEAEATASVLLIDSLTHPYRELLESYVRQKKDGTKFVRFQDWGPIKETWHKQFSEPYVNSKLHIMWASRAKNIYEDAVDTEASAQSGKEMFKPQVIGTGARSETESSYEPSLLIEMTKDMKHDGGKYVRRATVIKDRFSVIDSQVFDFEPFDPRVVNQAFLRSNATFKAFLPHIELLSLGGEHVGFHDDTSDTLFDKGPTDLAHRRMRQKKAWEEIENGLAMIYPAGVGKDKQARYAILSELTGSTSETTIQQLDPDILERVALTIRHLGQALLDGSAEVGDLIALKKTVRKLYEGILGSDGAAGDVPVSVSGADHSPTASAAISGLPFEEVMNRYSLSESAKEIAGVSNDVEKGTYTTDELLVINRAKQEAFKRITKK